MQQSAATRPTILVVDDEPIVREFACRTLTNANFNVLQAENGAAAISLLLTCLASVQLVLTDVRMPVMDGLRLAAAVRDLNGQIPVLFMSGYNSAGPIAKPYIAKPFRPSELLEAVREIVGKPT